MDIDSQNDELMVLASIYEDCFHEECSDSSKGGQLVIHFDLADPMTLVVDKDSPKYKNEDIKLRHLPPIYLNFSYPKDYPSTNAPDYTLSCKWITRPKLSAICKELDNLWEENKGEVIMYMWSQHIKDNSLNILKITDCVKISDMKQHFDDNNLQVSLDKPIGNDENSPQSSNNSENIIDLRTFQDVAPNTNMFKILKEYDIEIENKVFNNKSFECKVCFDDKSGTKCLKFWPCSHVYCKSCMKDYFQVQIKEGNINFLKCPSEKCNSEANPKQVEELVSKELYERWDKLLLSSTLSSLGDTQPCPRIHCQYPVTMDEDQGSCPACTFVFCGLCRAGWHGVESCKLKRSNVSEIMEWYSSGDSKVRQELEAKYGKKQLKKLHTEYLSMSYLKDNAKKCPRCSANIQKIDGCNKMVCNNCTTNFCWLCVKVLNAATPYEHFNKPGGGCANRLYEGILEFDDDIEFDFGDFDEDDGDFEVNYGNSDDEEYFHVN